MRALLVVLFFCAVAVPAFAGSCRLVNNTRETLSVQVQWSDGSFVGVVVAPFSDQVVSGGSFDALGLVYRGVYYANSVLPVDTDSPTDQPMEVSQQLLQDAIEYSFSYRN